MLGMHFLARHLDAVPNGAQARAAVRGVVGISGVYNVGRLRKAGGFPFSLISTHFYISPTFDNTDAARRLASPLTHASKPAPGLSCKVLLLSAGQDMHLVKDADEVRDVLCVCSFLRCLRKWFATACGSVA